MTIEKYSVGNDSLSAMGLSITGQVRSANEDSCGYEKTQNGELFVVCDGMGGHVGGATASRIGVESIINYMTKNSSRDKRKLIGESLKFANMQILGTASADPSLKGMGTTACVVLVEKDNVWIGHVGDSRIYLYSKNEKRLYRVTKDHSLVQSLVDKGELDDREAENHPQKNIILKALGTKMEVEPDVEHNPMKLSKGDIIMICSDGLSGMIDDIHIENVLKDKDDLEDKLQRLVGGANAPGLGKDNITCQLIEIEESNISRNLHPDYNPKWRKITLQSNCNGDKKIWPRILCGVLGLIIVVFVVVFAYKHFSKARRPHSKNIELTVGISRNVEEFCDVDYYSLVVKGNSEIIEFNEDSTSITATDCGNAELVVYFHKSLFLLGDKDSIVYKLRIKNNEAADKAIDEANKLKEQAEAEKAKADADAKAKAEKAKADADAKAKTEADAKAKAEKAKAEADAKAKPEKAKAEAEAKVKPEKAKAEAEAKVKAEKAKAEADAKAKAEQTDKSSADAK